MDQQFKLTSILLLLVIILSPTHFTQQEPFGYKISGNGDVISDAFFIQYGFVLDSAIYNNKTYKFEYNDEGKLIRDINFISFTIYTDYGMVYSEPGSREYYYNEREDIDSIVYGRWIDSLQAYEKVGGSINYNYNSEGKIVSKTYFNGQYINKVEEYSYDLSGNLILSKVIRISDTTYTFREYDSLNRLILTKSFQGSSPSYYQWIYEYDSSGNISCTNQVIGYHDIPRNYLLKFDESGKVVNEIHRSFNSTDSTWIDKFEILFTYDNYGRATKMGETGGFNYNNDGNLETLKNPPVPINSGYLNNRATLIDSYSNEFTFPEYKRSFYFYYSKLVTSVKKDKADKTFLLLQNYPNPFNPVTKISWQSAVNSLQTIKIYDMLGREVATLLDEYKPAGNYEVEFDAAGLASGIYYYRLSAGEFTEIKKMLMVK